MTSGGVGRAAMMSLGELVRLYRRVAGDFGVPIPLSAFLFTTAETERLFSSYGEDYQISRFFRFSQNEGTSYSVNGEPATHVAIDSEIEIIL